MDDVTHGMTSWCLDPHRLMLAGLAVALASVAIQFYATKDGKLRKALIAHFGTLAWACAFWAVMCDADPSVGTVPLWTYGVSVVPAFLSTGYLSWFIRRNF